MVAAAGQQAGGDPKSGLTLLSQSGDQILVDLRVRGGKGRGAALSGQNLVRLAAVAKSRQGSASQYVPLPTATYKLTDFRWEDGFLFAKHFSQATSPSH